MVAVQVESNGSGGYTEVGSRDPVEGMQRRYILSASVVDFTKDTAINIFNEQAAAMLGMSADQLHDVKVCILLCFLSMLVYYCHRCELLRFREG